MTLAGRVKCIYVDPPYNTGNRDWVYNDHYIGKDDRWRHSTWLEFLFRRFTLARDLLTEDGVILVSINDDNRARLELMLDQALPGMRVGSFTWRTRTGGNDTKGAFLSDNHEHVLAFAKKAFRFGGTEKTYEKYKEWDPVRKDWLRESDISQPKDMAERPNGFYAMHDPVTDVYYPANPQRVWPSPTPRGARYESSDFWGSDFPVFPLPEERVAHFPFKDQIAAWVREGRIRFPQEQQIEVWSTLEALTAAISSGDVPKAKKTPKLWADMPNLEFWVGKRVGFGIPQWVRYRSELKTASQPISSWITPSSETETLDRQAPEHTQLVSNTNQSGTSEIQGIFGSKAFSYPKPVSLIRELVRQTASPGDIVLDFFAGSATTAQAVMELNAADGGERRFIMASSTERTADEPDKNLCDQVTAERVRRLNASTDPAHAELNAPFAYLRMVRMGFEDIDYDLTPAQAWAGLEAMHGLPLTSHPGGGWAVHEGEATTLVLAETVDNGLIAALRDLAGRRANVFVYAWAPGQVTAALDGLDVEVRPLRETLVQRFRR